MSDKIRDAVQHLVVDALTAADLVRSGHRSKALSDRLSQHCSVLSKMIAAVPAAPVAPWPATWVSVADRLPGEDSEVIVSGWAYNDPARGRFVTHADFSDGQFKPVGAADEYDALHPPTHWRPMPAAPGEAPTPTADQPDASAQLASIEAMCAMVEAREWADHVGVGEIGKRVESAISTLRNELQEAQRTAMAEQPDAVRVLHELPVDDIERRGTSGHLRCTCPSGDGSLRWPCPAHPPSVSRT